MRFAGLFNKGRKDRELQEELASHIQMHMEDNLRSGMTPEEARRQAMIQMGGIESTKEAYREQRGLPLLETLFQDLRFGARMLRKNSGFTSVAVLTLALGIGASTAIFSMFDAVLLKPLPYHNPEQLVSLTELHQKGYTRATSFPNFCDWCGQNTVLSELAGMSSAAYNLAGDGEPERVLAQRVSAEFFPLLGVNPVLGRWFTDAEDRANAERVVIISYGLWQRRFSGSSDAVGKRIILDGDTYTIVGVMPSVFQSIAGSRYLSSDGTRDVWTPLATDATRSGRGKVFLRLIGRLKPGVSIEAASSELNAVANRLAKQFPSENTGFGIQVRGLHEDLVENTQSTVWLLMGAVALLLMIACANVANLFLVRASARASEITIRAALGAGRARIIRQLLTESALVALGGGVFGVGLGWLGMNLLQRFLPSGQIPLQAAQVNFTELGFALAISLASGLIFGLAPALHSAKVDLNDALKSAGKGTVGGRRGNLRSSFVVAEIALAFVLLASAGLVIKSLGQLLKVNPGFRADNVLTMRIHLSGARYAEAPKTRAFYDQLLAGVKALPGVESVGGVTSLPMSGSISTSSFLIEGQPEPEGNANYTDVQTATSDYFHVMGIPLLKGRVFGRQDDEHTPGVVLINQQMAVKFWPGEDPIGRWIRFSDGKTNYEIVGIVGDVRHFGLSAGVRPETYMPQSQQFGRSMMLAVRAKANPTALVREIRAQITQLDPNVPLADVGTLEATVAATTSDQRATVFLLAAFAVAALVLSAVGIYGVISNSVVQRTRDVGIRMALGAQAGDVRRMVMRQGLMLALFGLAIGVIASFVSSRLLTSALFEVTAGDPVTLAAVSFLLILVALLACWLPARRATKVDPMVALRHE
jgi:putative ABC transport system permease protein